MDNSEPKVSMTAAYLHRLAGAILLLFAISHFGFLNVKDSSNSLPNVAFPFLTNWTVYLFAAIFEISVALMCLVFSGKDVTNIIILSFVGIVSLYRWGFYSEGGVLCNCLGLLGRLYHVSKTEENILPIVCLGSLVLTTTPWLCRNAGNILKNGFLVTFVFLLTTVQVTQCQTLEIYGVYQVVRYNARKATVYSNETLNASFRAIISRNGWKIDATNLDDRASWNEIIYDGTNTYTFTPYAGHFVNPASQTNLVFCTISPGPIYVSPVSDLVDSYIPWITYCVSPRNIKEAEDSPIEIPNPWALSRLSLGAYGYNWIMKPSVDGWFIKSCRVVRDTSLDFSLKKELLQPQIDYPDTLADFNRVRSDYQADLKGVPNGFVAMYYEVNVWLKTNNLAVPEASAFEFYVPPYPISPLAVVNLSANSIIVRPGREKLLPLPSDPTLVHDYRYKARNGPRMFPYATYTLQAGSSWKTTNDPTILAQETYQLEYGRKFADFGYKNVLIWLLMMVLITTSIIVWRYKKRTAN